MIGVTEVKEPELRGDLWSRYITQGRDSYMRPLSKEHFLELTVCNIIAILKIKNDHNYYRSTTNTSE